MARVTAVLGAVARAFRRDQRSLETVAGNNFFIVSALLLREAGGFIYLLIGLVLLFPLSTDPLRKVPASRLALWPLDTHERWLLRALSPWVNPVSWAVLGLAVWSARGKVTVGLWALAAGLFAAAFLISDLPWFSGRALLRKLPPFPGPWNQLVRKNVREMLSTLDFYCGLLLCLAVLGFRVGGVPLPREAFLAITVLVQIALSSYAQCLFGLDGYSGLSRYRLLPLRGWQILLAKDIAFLLVALLLALFLAPLPGLGAALIALAMGHAPSVERPRQQARWRFSSGGSIVYGLVQAGAMGMAACTIALTSSLVLLGCIAVCAGSAWYYGRRLDGMLRSDEPD
jgi:hypothetical protein